MQQQQQRWVNFSFEKPIEMSFAWEKYRNRFDLQSRNKEEKKGQSTTTTADATISFH